MEGGILLYVAMEYHYDKAKDDAKKQKKTRTTKKTTNMPSGDVITEESIETVESTGEPNEEKKK